MQGVNPSCCTPTPASPPTIDQDLLDDTIQALNVKLKALQYQCTQLTLRAKLYRAQGDEVRCMEEMRIRREKEALYKKWVALYGNVCRVRDSIDETHTLGEVTGSLSLANQSLREALLKVDVEKIEDLMDQLQEGMEQAGQVGEVLGREIDLGELGEEWGQGPIPPTPLILPASPPSHSKHPRPTLVADFS